MLALPLVCAAALATANPAAASDEARRGERIERFRDGCVRELDRYRDRALVRFGARLADSEWLTAEHVVALQGEVDDLSAKVDAAIATANAATSRRALRTACDPRPLRRHLHLVRFQVRTVGAADQVDSMRAALQRELDDLAAALATAEVVDADLMVAETQGLLDNVDVTGLAETILALDPDLEGEALHGAMADVREEIETAVAELEGVAGALSDLAALLDAPDNGGDGPANN